MEKICVVCGKPFVTSGYAAKFCSFECSEVCGKAHRVKPDGWVYHGTCPRCGKQFESKRTRKYCTDECLYQAMLEKSRAARERPKPPCKHCGEKLPSIKQVFCSDECKHEYYRKTDKVPLTYEIISARIAERYDNIELVSGNKSDGLLIVRCKVCGGEFSIGEKATRIASKSRIRFCPCCSNVQKAEKAKKKVTRSCTVCGQDILNSQPSAKYCSVACRKVAASRQSHEKRVSERECRYCGNLFVPKLKEMWAFCSETCFAKQKADMRRQHKHIRRAKKWNNGDVDYGISLDKLIKRDKNVCHICGLKCDKGDYTTDANGNYIIGGKHPSVDHVMPLANGGTHTWDNVKLAHCMCNSLKSNNTCYERSNGQMALAI